MSEVRDNRIAELLLREDMSLADVAALCEVKSTRTIERWTREEVEIPDHQKRRLADRFHVSVEYLMGWDRIPTAASSREGVS
jgi:transcriptional regulator with XRE-family HTH domain